MSVNPTTAAMMVAVTPQPGGAMCAKFTNALKEARVWYDWFSWMYTEGGEFTEEFKLFIAEARA